MASVREIWTVVAVVSLAWVTGCSGRGCSSGAPSAPAWRLVKAEDGTQYRLVERGRYRTYYDMGGALERIEYDSDADGRADHVAHFDGADVPRLLEVDSNLDGVVDRWEYYDDAGDIVKVGYSDSGALPERWAFPDADGLPQRMEYDSDADQKVDRVEIFDQGRLVGLEVDSDRDGQMDRWQDWRSGILGSEDVDTDADGRPDVRLRYDASGRVEALEQLPPGE